MCLHEASMDLGHAQYSTVQYSTVQYSRACVDLGHALHAEPGVDTHQSPTGDEDMIIISHNL